jgi:hypothetical protein
MHLVAEDLLHMIVHQRDFFSLSSSTAEGIAVVGVFSTDV